MKLFSILTAAAGLLIVSACASTASAPIDERVHVTSEMSACQPGSVYITPDAADVFTLRDIETEINEGGYLAVRVFGKTEELSALKWAFCGDVEYDFGYQFLWFDADGNRISSDVQRFRKAIPGDPVRFVGHAPAEACRDYALILKMASEIDEPENAEPAEEEVSEPAETRSEAAEEESRMIEENIPSLPQENISGDTHDVKTIGVPNENPAAVPADKQ